MNLKVKAGLKTLAVFGVAIVSSLVTTLIIMYVPPMVIAMSLLIVALTIISHTVYKYFLTIGEVQEKLNTLIGKLEK
jgi:hypothetical protein